MKPSPCPCGRSDPKGRVWPEQDCCGPFHAGLAAPDAESLMRSRYSAFVVRNMPYLLDTWHASTRPASLDLDEGAKWLGLEIKHYRSTSENTAEVEFVARFRVAGRAVRQHELSRFVREHGRWFYLNGDVR